MLLIVIAVCASDRGGSLSVSYDEDYSPAAASSSSTAPNRAAGRVAAGIHARQTGTARQSYEGSVQYWSDYATFATHGKNIFTTTGIHHGVNAFDYFPEGSTLADETDMVSTNFATVRCSYSAERMSNSSDHHSVRCCILLFASGGGCHGSCALVLRRV